MTTFHHRALPDHSALLSGHTPPDMIGFRSERLQVWYNNTTEPWTDPRPHAHTESDEIFIVLRGSIVVEVEGQRVTVGPREFCCFPTGVYHHIVAVHPPVETLMIRAPSVSDKVYLAQDEPFYTSETVPLDDEPESEEERQAVAEALAASARGEVHTTAEVRRRLGL